MTSLRRAAGTVEEVSSASSTVAPAEAAERSAHPDELLPARPGVRTLVGAALLVAALVAAHALSLDERARAFLQSPRAAGPWGVLLHAAAYVGAALLGLPASPLTLLAGARYGALAGAALAIPSSTLGACAAFLVGRIIARDPAAIARGEGRVARAARAIGRGGLRLVLFLRLAPVVPFSVLNFAFGATPTRLSHFAAGSFVGTIPSQLGYACLGAVLAWPAGPDRTRAEIALVAAAALLSVAGSAGVLALVRRHRRAASAAASGS